MRSSFDSFGCLTKGKEFQRGRFLGIQPVVGELGFDECEEVVGSFSNDYCATDLFILQPRIRCCRIGRNGLLRKRCRELSPITPGEKLLNRLKLSVAVLLWVTSCANRDGAAQWFKIVSVNVINVAVTSDGSASLTVGSGATCSCTWQ